MKYKRITGKVFGGNATATGDDPQIAQFGSASAGTFIGTTDPEVIQQLPAWSQGWIGAVTPDTQFPALPEMTGAMKVLSHQICTILQEGVSSWDSGTIYYDGNWVSKNGNLYKSLTDENQGNDPETDTTNWKEHIGNAPWVSPPILTLAYDVAYPKNANIYYNLSDYLPQDSYNYKIQVTGRATTGSEPQDYCILKISSSENNRVYLCGAITRIANTNWAYGTCEIAIGADRTLTVERENTATANGTFFLYLTGYSKLGK